MQQTVAGCVRFEGIGLHTGVIAKMEIRPAQAGCGILFVRTGLPGGAVEIPARHEFISSSSYRTVLGNPEGVGLATVEHLMAALAVLGIDNAVVVVDGPEVPILDGSALPFARAILETGIVPSGGMRRAIRICRKVEVESGGSRAALLPSREFRLACSIDFPSPAIGRQDCQVEGLGLPAVYSLLPARTFAELESIEALRKMGLARGGSLDNAVVVSGNKVLNENGLRFSDEFARHKALDVVGDLFLAGAPILGHCIAVRPGHAITRRLLSAVFSTPGAWAWADAAEMQPESRRAFADAVESLPDWT